MIVTIQLDTRLEADAETLARMTDMFGRMPPEAKSPVMPVEGGVKRGPGRPRKVVEPTPIQSEPVPTPPYQEPAIEGEPSPEVEDAPDDPEPVPVMTVVEFRATAVAYAKERGGQVLLAILKRHGYGNIGAVPEDKIAAIAAELV